MLASNQLFLETALNTDTLPGVEVGDDLNAARLRSAVNRMSRRLRPTSAAGTLTTTEVDILVAAERQGPVRMSDLAGFAGLNPTMLTRLIPKLEAAGLIRRIHDAADRRVCRVTATPKGSRLLDRIRSERNDALSRRLRDLEPGERDTLALALPILEDLAERLRAGWTSDERKERTA
jgi:DNA-binding MarR family transcriptional regulator